MLSYRTSGSNTLQTRDGQRKGSLKAVSQDAISLMRFGFMKLVSPCDRAKTCRKRLLKVPCDCFYDRALLYSCNSFRATFPYQPIRFSIISVQWGKTNFIFSAHMVTIFTYHIHTSIYYNTCVKCERHIKT